MTVARGTVLLLTLAAGLQLACGPLRSRSPQGGGQGDQVVLLPEADGGVGRAIVATPAGEVELRTARASTYVRDGQAPSPAAELSEAEVQRIFGAALEAQPPAAVHYVLYFRFDSEQLTDDSRALLSKVLQTARTFPAPRVTVVGHTDTSGSIESNVELGLRRANAVRVMLVETGLETSAIDVASHGEATPIVPTGDDVIEPKNRRVEITIR